MYNFDLTALHCNNLLSILDSINYTHIDSTEELSIRMKEILHLLFKMDAEFYTKLRNIITKSYFEQVSSIKDSIYNVIYKKTNNTFFIDKYYTYNYIEWK